MMSSSKTKPRDQRGGRRTEHSPWCCKSRGCCSFKASKGEAVVGYRNPLATQKMHYHRLSRKGKQQDDFLLVVDITFGEFDETALMSQKGMILLYFCYPSSCCLCNI